MSTPETLSITMLARRWGVSKDSVYRYLRDDMDMPRPFTLPSGLPRWRTAEVEAYENARRSSRSTDAPPRPCAN